MSHKWTAQVGRMFELSQLSQLYWARILETFEGAQESIPSPAGCYNPEPEFVNLLRSSEIDSQSGGPVRQPYLTYWPARPHRLAESIPWNRCWAPLTFTNSGSGYIGWRNRFLCSLNVYKSGLSLHRPAESIPVFLKRLRTWALYNT